MCSIVIYVDDTLLTLKCDQASDFQQQLELACGLESDLGQDVDWGRKWLVDFNAGKIQLVSFDRSNTGAIDVKMDASVLEEKSSFKMMGQPFSFKLDWGCYIFSIAETTSKKIGTLIRSLKFLSVKLLFISVNLPYGLARILLSCQYWCSQLLLEYARYAKQVYRAVGPIFDASLEPQAHRSQL